MGEDEGLGLVNTSLTRDLFSQTVEYARIVDKTVIVSIILLNGLVSTLNFQFR